MISLPSLNNERIDKVYIGNQRECYDIIVHLMNGYGDHITGYSLVRINHDGLMKFKSVGKSATNHNLFKCIDLDKELKLCITGIDEI